MAIEVIGTLKPKNNGSFPIAEAKDIVVDDNGTRLDEKLLEMGTPTDTAAETPTFDLAEMGLGALILDGTEVFVQTDTTEMISALEKGAVMFSLNMLSMADFQSLVPLTITPTSVSMDGQWMCTAVVELNRTKLLANILVQEDAVIVWASGFESATEKVATSIDMSKFDTNGQITETYADGSTKTTTIEFDADGNPVKITDGDGNVTTLTW